MIGMHPAPRKQSGFVLVTAVMFLVVLTILALSIIGTGTLEERMAGYSRDRQLAFQSAEAALRDAERDMKYSGRIINVMGFMDNCSDDGLCFPKATGSPIWADLETPTNLGYPGWMNGADAVKSTKYGSQTNAGTLQHVAAQPRYIFEAITLSTGELKYSPGSSGRLVYRVTAVGFGRQITTRVVLQATYFPQ